MKKIIYLVAAAAATLATPAFAAEFVTNGGFEQTTSPAGPGASFEFGASYAGRANAVTGWTSSNSNAFNLLFNSATATTTSASTRFGNYQQYLWSGASVNAATPAFTASPNGGNFVALDGDTGVAGPLSQLINGLTIGDTYTLKFNWAAGQLRNRDGDTTEKLTVTFGGSTFTTATISNPSHDFSGWQSVTTTFKATSASQLLSFLSIGTPNGLPPVALLDGVSLTSAVPEPTTWAMMMLGFGMIGVAARRKRASGSLQTA
jgi:hypothetical protein